MDKGKTTAFSSSLAVPLVSSPPSALAGTAVRLGRPSAMMLGGLGGQMFGAKSLGVAGHTITTTLKLQKLADVTDHLGFMLEMPLGKSNKDDGFGMTHGGELLLLLLLPSQPFDMTGISMLISTVFS